MIYLKNIQISMTNFRKNERRQSSLKRRRALLNERDSFLIICEGENTEPIYFRSFRLSSARVKTLSYPNKGNAMNFINSAILYKNIRKDDFDHYWVVFDKDANTNANFNSAINLAKLQGFNVAYSIQSFEFWFILHFHYHLGSMPRNTFKTRLDRHLPFPYAKDKETCKKIYPFILQYQATAIQNAENVYNRVGDHSNIAIEESSTTVQELVKCLNKFL
jgi:hypothetical protein